MKIIFFTKYDRKGASSRYRTLQFLPYFPKNNIQYDYYPLFNDEYLYLFYNNKKIPKLKIILFFINRVFNLFKIRKYDLVVIEKELFPYFPPFFERLLQICNVKYILDYDDAIFHNYDLNNNKYIRTLLKNKIPKVMKGAAGIVCGSPYLQEFAKKYNSKVYLIPTVIELKKYNSSISNTQTSDKFIIGWIGSKSTSKNIIDILPALQSICLKYNEVMIHLVGFDKTLENLLEDVRYKIIDWSEENEIIELNKFSVGIMPLKDEPWERGKCGFKLIQYMACKKPVIGSPVGANNSIIDKNENGFFATTYKEWLEGFTKLLDDKNKCNELGQNGYKKIKEKYSLEVVYTNYLKIFKETVDSK